MEALRAAGGSTAEAIASECDAHRSAWRAHGSGSDPIADGRPELRRRIFDFAGMVDDDDRRRHLVRLAAQIGTP